MAEPAVILPAPATRSVRGAAGAAALTLCAGVALIIAAVLAGPGLGAAGYVSEAGTAGSPAAGTYRTGVLALALGIGLLAHALAGLGRPVAGLLAAAAVAASVSGAVPCSGGCPLPPYETATGADLVHLGAGVLGMAACVFAMVAVAVSPPATRALRRLATVAAAVALPQAAALAVAMLFAGRGTPTGLLERLLLLTAAGWLVATAALRAAREAPAGPPTTIDDQVGTPMFRSSR